MVVPAVEPSDETLAARAAAGDSSAFETIVREVPLNEVPLNPSACGSPAAILAAG